MFVVRKKVRFACHAMEGASMSQKPSELDAFQSVHDRISDLLKLSSTELEDVQRKATMAFNIAILEEACRQLAGVVLAPRLVAELSDLLRASAQVALTMHETAIAVVEHPESSQRTCGPAVDPLAEALSVFERMETTLLDTTPSESQK
jgi:hypothetical protein